MNNQTSGPVNKHSGPDGLLFGRNVSLNIQPMCAGTNRAMPSFERSNLTELLVSKRVKKELNIVRRSLTIKKGRKLRNDSVINNVPALNKTLGKRLKYPTSQTFLPLLAYIIFSHHNHLLIAFVKPKARNE